jgi:hypothetical protein
LIREGFGGFRDGTHLEQEENVGIVCDSGFVAGIHDVLVAARRDRIL